MPRRPDFKISDETVEVVFPTVGILTASGGGIEFDEPIIGAYYDNSPKGQGTYTLSPIGGIRYFDLQKSQLASAGEFATKLVFQDGETVYLIRPVYPEDGIKFSKYRIPVPVASLETKFSLEARPMIEDQLRIASSGSGVPLPFFESLVVFYSEELNTLADVVYMSSQGTYYRDDGGWLSLDFSDRKYENFTIFEISATKAKEFLEAFDNDSNMNTKDIAKYSSNN